MAATTFRRFLQITGLLWASMPTAALFAAAAPPSTVVAPSPLTPLLDMEAPGAPRRIFTAPRITHLVGGDLLVEIRPSAVLAWDKAVIPPAQLTIDSALPLPPRLGAGVPAGATFVRQRAPAGESACLTKTEEPRDPDLDAPVAVCLVDSDGDGAGDRLLVGTEPPREIAPVPFRPLTGETRVAPPVIDFRVVVLEVAADRVAIGYESRIQVGGGQRRYVVKTIGQAETPSGRGRIDLPLREGAAVDFFGLSLRPVKDAQGRWSIEVDGQLDWISVRNDGAMIDLTLATMEMI